MTCFLFLVALFLAMYFCIRLYILKKALRETDSELQEIQKNLTQNQVLHLPLPDKDLEILMNTINSALDEIREERKKYIKHEHEFQSQIEAVSHDLRTPLTVILGYLKLLQKQEQNNAITDEQREMLNTIIRKAQSMEKLIAQFYDYSRLTASDYKLPLEEIDAGKILREVFVDNCLMLETAHLQVYTDFANHPIYVKGEKGALERILTNLLQNVGRYANSFLRLAIKKDGKRVQIIFENDTQKISAKDIPYLFEPFYTNDLSRNQGGSGLGLTIAKGLAEEIDGELEAHIISCDSRSGNILIRFTLYLESHWKSC